MTLSMTDIVTNMIEQWTFVLFHNERINGNKVIGSFHQLKRLWLFSIGSYWSEWILDAGPDGPAYIIKNPEGHFVPTPAYYESRNDHDLIHVTSERTAHVVSLPHWMRHVYKCFNSLKVLHSEFRSLLTNMRKTSETWKNVFDDDNIIPRADRYFWNIFLKELMNVSWPHPSTTTPSFDSIADPKIPLEELPSLATAWNHEWKSIDDNKNKISWSFSDFSDGTMARKIGYYLMDDITDEKTMAEEIDRYMLQDFPTLLIGGIHPPTVGLPFILKDIVFRYHEALWLQRFLLAKEKNATLKEMLSMGV